MYNARPRDASWLIGPLIVLPALIYLSYWCHQNAAFLSHAYIVEAKVTEIEVWGGSRMRGYSRRREYRTHVEFSDAQGNLLPGLVFGRQLGKPVGSHMRLYYNQAFEDLRFPGLFGIWGGLAAALSAIGLGAVLGLLAYHSSGQSEEQPGQDELLF